MNKSFVDYVIQDYTKPMGVATYRTSKDMSYELKKALPDIETLKRLPDSEEDMGKKKKVRAEEFNLCTPFLIILIDSCL